LQKNPPPVSGSTGASDFEGLTASLKMPAEKVLPDEGAIGGKPLRTPKIRSKGAFRSL